MVTTGAEEAATSVTNSPSAKDNSARRRSSAISSHFRQVRMIRDASPMEADSGSTGFGANFPQ
ncbi:hypothetical protein SNA_25300 [Streptomyces natalensis ATCC 27448]|uniref:Uncharacterized protein n=1 Tax=Streptomyces natalensis ATCC 27448 TaxID=1240678 RepID=A0A0D7CIH4_9ACTN|nr:hypothetical protein SNA_25300 [Streptomyces natalensis ATCC 27448]